MSLYAVANDAESAILALFTTGKDNPDEQFVLASVREKVDKESLGPCEPVRPACSVRKAVKTDLS